MWSTCAVLLYFPTWTIFVDWKRVFSPFFSSFLTSAYIQVAHSLFLSGNSRPFFSVHSLILFSILKLIFLQITYATFLSRGSPNSSFFIIAFLMPLRIKKRKKKMRPFVGPPSRRTIRPSVCPSHDPQSCRIA